MSSDPFPPTDEHDDDLESEVSEGSEEERDVFPDTADDFDEPTDATDGEPDADEDEAEL